MQLGRLLHPRTVAVVGATDRPGSYAGQTLLNLAALGYPGRVWGVNPGRQEAHGVPCFPSLSDLESPPDAVVVAIPAAGVPDVIEEAGATGCGGAVVYGSGFGEMAAAAGSESSEAVRTGARCERALREAAARHALPVCGPNGNGIVALHERAALWGDALRPLEAGAVALVSQSGNVAVNALATRRGLRLHTVVSCGNSVALDPAAWVRELAVEDGVRSIALYLEADGDGALLCEALARCAERGVGVAVLKVGASAAGATAAAAHTGAVAGDQRVFRALVEEAGAAWAADVHELLELAKALAVPEARPRAAGAKSPPGLAVLTCSGGDSSLAADQAERIGVSLPPLRDETQQGLRRLLPAAASVGNPLDYTALIWGEWEKVRDIVALVGTDPAIDQLLVLYDQPAGIDGPAEESWSAVREGILAGAAASAVPVMLASTLPELLDDAAAWRFIEAGVPAISGLRTGLTCAAALRCPPADPARLHATGRVCRPRAARSPVRWLAEHEAKELLRAAGVPVVEGRAVGDEDAAAAAFADLGPPVAVKLSSPALRHKSELGALALELRAEPDVRAAYRRLRTLDGLPGASVLVEHMAAPGVELIVAARADAVVPALAIGLGGIWTEALDDVAIVALPASPERVAPAIRGLRGAPLLSGGRGRAPLDIDAVAELAAGAGRLLLDAGLELVELNPVVAYEHGALAVDAAVARR